MAADESKKILEVRVEEASGINRMDEYVWDEEITQGFVKAEIRGGQRAIKAATDKADVKDNQIVWHQDLHLEVYEGATELRLLLCREKMNNGKKGVSVITACGIYVKDILEAVPIDKYFEMFKPGTGGEGGYIRLKMRLVTEDEISKGTERGAPRRRGLLAKVALSAVVIAGALFAKKRLDKTSDGKA